MTSHVKFNKGQLKLFFYWINEREKIRKRKEAGQPWPWTNDNTLRVYKFTNARRRYDRTTVDLVDRVAKISDPAKLLMHICIFRLFNWTPTYDAIVLYLKHFDLKKARKYLLEMKDEGEQLWTGAYMIHADPGAKRSKVDSYMDTIDAIYNDHKQLAKSIVEHNRMSFATLVMQKYNHIGAFIAYELACDFSYFAPLLKDCTDRYTWANTGPGAARGINRLLFESHVPQFKIKEEGYVGYMRELLKMSPMQLDKHVGRLEMRDIEHSLCEFDKYSRVYNDEGRSPKQKYKPPGERK